MRLSSILNNTIRHHNAWFMDGGLYGGAKIRFGNRISEFKNKSRRKFALNLHWVSLHSQMLSRNIRVRVTTSVLKTIDALGGLDNYIMGQRQLEGLKAETLKKAIVLGAWRRELQEKGIQLQYPLKPVGRKI